MLQIRTILSDPDSSIILKCLNIFPYNCWFFSGKNISMQTKTLIGGIFKGWSGCGFETAASDFWIRRMGWIGARAFCSVHMCFTAVPLICTTHNCRDAPDTVPDTHFPRCSATRGKLEFGYQFCWMSFYSGEAGFPDSLLPIRPDIRSISHSHIRYYTFTVATGCRK